MGTDTEWIRRELRDLVDGDVRADGPDLVRARRTGRRVIRHRRIGAAATAGTVAAAVVAVTVAVEGREDPPPPAVAAPAATVRLANPLVPKAVFGWLPEGYDGSIVRREAKWTSVVAQARAGQFLLTVFPPGPEPELGRMAGGRPAKAVPVAPVNGRRAHWLQPPSHRIGDARLRIELARGQWAELEVNAWITDATQVIRQVAEGLKVKAAPTAFPLKINGVPKGFTAGDASVSNAASGDGWMASLTLQPGVNVYVTRHGDTNNRYAERGRVDRTPNTTINGRPAVYVIGAAAGKGRPMSKDSGDWEAVCLIDVKGLDLCMETDSEKARRLLKPSGGLRGLAARTELLGVNPAGWTTRPLG